MSLRITAITLRSDRGDWGSIPQGTANLRHTGYSSVWPEHRVWGAGVRGSNPRILTNFRLRRIVALRLIGIEQSRVRFLAKAPRIRALIMQRRLLKDPDVRGHG